MAIYHLQCKMNTRTKGGNAVASAAYRRGLALACERENKTYSYTNKEEVEYSNFVIPENSPSWLKAYSEQINLNESAGIASYWNYIESIEKRKDSSLSRDFIVALPKELTLEQQIRLADEFVKDQFAKRGIVSDYSIHQDKDNPHLHIATSTRVIEEQGFGKKNRDWNDKVFLKEIRASWSDYANFHLKLSGHDVRIDHRSYKEQGIDLIPSFHIGRAAYDLEKRGVKTDVIARAEEIRAANLERITKNPVIVYDKLMLERESFSANHVVDEVSRFTRVIVPSEDEISRAKLLSEEKINKILGSIEHHQSVFTHRDLAKALDAHLHQEDGIAFQHALSELHASSDLMYLGAGDDGQDRYTTRKMFKLENGIQADVDVLKEGKHFSIGSNKVDAWLAEYEEKQGKPLLPEQSDAVRFVVGDKRLACLVGRAGTGKSFSLGAANAIWQKAGLDVFGVALSGVAADGLSKDAGINASTIESFKIRVKEGKIHLGRRSVVVMDEAGMTDSVSMAFVLDVVKKARAKLVLVGDHGQLQPVGPGAAFRAILERVVHKELSTVFRQREVWQKEATSDFAKGEVVRAVEAYDAHHCITYRKTRADALSSLIENWGESYRAGQSIKERVILAYTREDVKELNQLARAVRVAAGDLQDGYKIQCERGEVELAAGDRILFLKNDRDLGVKNGRFAIVDGIERRGGKTMLYATLDGEDGKKVAIDTAKYAHFDYGYAATVHKTQGVTLDQSFLYVSQGWDRCLAYVGMSRHRESCQVFTDLADKAELTKVVSKYAIKDSLFDFAYHFAARRGLDDEGLGVRLKTHLLERLQKLKGLVLGQQNMFNVQHWDEVGRCLEQNADLKSTFEMREKARVVAAYVNTNREAGIVYEKLNMKMSELGMKRLDYRAPEMAILRGSEDYKNFIAYLGHRDQLAHEITADLPSYKRAIEVSNIDVEKLKAYGQKHARRLLVKDYVVHAGEGRAILRDKLAFKIAGDIKDFYPLLKDSGIDTSGLYNQARSHERRLFSRDLAPDERIRLKEVERYLELKKETDRIYWRFNEKFKNLQKVPGSQIQKWDYMKEPHFKQIAKERDELAFKIFNHVADYNKDLDFYEVGLARPRYGSLEKPTDEAIQKATKRWYNMEQHANNHQVRVLLQAYIGAGQDSNENLKQQLAHQILQDKAASFREFAQEMGPKNAMWFEINKDAKAFNDLNFYRGLTNESDRVLFKQVESFIAARSESCKAWSEVFAGQPEGIKPEQVDDIFSSAAKTLSRHKQYLAQEVLKNFGADHPVFKHFDLNFEDLKNDAGFRKLDDDGMKLVLQYQKLASAKTDHIERAKLARVILENKDTLKGAITALKIDWKDLFTDSTNAYRHYVVNDLLPEYKADIRVAWKYQEKNREVGVLFSKLAELKAEKQVISTSLQVKANRALSDRDALAHRLVDCNKGVVQFVLPNRSEKLRDQAQRHREKMQEVRGYLSLREGYRAQVLRSIENGQVNIDLIALGDELNGMLKPLSGEGFESALRACDLNKVKIGQDEALRASYSSYVSLEAEKYFAGSVCENYAPSEQELKQIKRAQNLIRQSIPVAGTLGERYLREERGIVGPLPESCRYISQKSLAGEKVGALLFIGEAPEEKLGRTVVQAIHLDPVTGKKANIIKMEGAEEVKVPVKLSYGRFLEGSAILINKGKDESRIAIAEGPETALSIKAADPDLRVYAVLGTSNLKKVPISPETKEVILCADYDGVGSASERLVNDAAEHYAKEKGVDVYKIIPNGERGKEDFNDILLKDGVERVGEYLAHPEKIASGLSIEALRSEIKQNLESDAGLEAKVQENSTHPTEDINSIVKEYVELSLAEDKLMHQVDVAYLRREMQDYAKLKSELKDHSNTLLTFAERLAKTPIILNEIEKEASNALNTISSRGGFKAIQERFNKDEFEASDIIAVAKKIRRAGLEKERARERSIDMGGFSY